MFTNEYVVFRMIRSKWKMAFTRSELNVIVGP